MPPAGGKDVPYVPVDGAELSDGSDSGSSSFRFDEQVGPKSWKESLEDWFYPPTLRPELQLWRWTNIAIPLSYLMVGTFQGLTSGVMAVYPIEIGANEAQQSTIKVLRSLPASFKIGFGFLSDTVPLFGYRRKGYMLLGWLLSSLSMFAILASGTPSVPRLALLYFLFGLGFWFADVIADSLVAEKAKLENEEVRGQLQATCYMCRFFMLMVSIAFATYAYEALSPQFMFWMMAILPVVVMVPAVLLLREEQYGAVPSVRQQCQEIWSSVCSRAVWQPMAFIYIYNMMQIGNAAWTQFLYTVLKFTPAMINSLSVVSYVLLYAGIWIYKTFMMKWSWKSVYVLTSLVNSVFSLLQIVLIFRWNTRIGISDYLFALGDDALAELIGGMQFLPTTILMVQLCPVGSEGASYALFTSVNNSALSVASSLSTLMLGIWDVSKKAFEHGYYTGMAKLTLFTTYIQTAAVLWVFLLPRGRDDLQDLNVSPKSRLGGIVILAVVTAGIAFTVFDGLMNILRPGWSGES
mmetsp:Transcript_535/g.1833  ORF Transcript_535/g.1833 Transcript_535/m.1833 type:complete len:521 (-) Transcript_535:139-1701(-)